MVPVSSNKISRVPFYSGYSSVCLNFVYGVITLYDAAFQQLLLSLHILNGAQNPNSKLVWPSPLSLATTEGIASFSFPAATEMFHFTACCLL